MKHFKQPQSDDLKTKSEIVDRRRALKNQLEKAKRTAHHFNKDDAALRTYKTVLNARIQELTWVLKDTKLFIIKNDHHD